MDKRWGSEERTEIGELLHFICTSLGNFYGEGNEFVIFSLNDDAESSLPGNPCHVEILPILSNGCILKEHIQEVVLEISE